MEKTYRVVRRNDNNNNDYLEHKFKPKYVDKFKDEKGNWRYVYMEKTGKNGGKTWEKTTHQYNQYSGKDTSRYGTYKHGNEQYRYSASNKLLSSKKEGSYVDSEGNKIKYTDYHEGKLERGMESVGKSLNKLKKTTLKNVNKAAKHGRSLIDKLFSKPKKKDKSLDIKWGKGTLMY